MRGIVRWGSARAAVPGARRWMARGAGHEGSEEEQQSEYRDCLYVCHGLPLDGPRVRMLNTRTSKPHARTPELLREAVGCQGYQQPTSKTVSIKLLLSVCECVHAGARRSRDVD